MNERLKLILNELIKYYLRIKEPISSKSLKDLAHLNISASTIRGYFQNLEKEGMLKKEHISSGSYPSVKAMELFWNQMLPKNCEITIDRLNKKCKEFDIFAYIKISENQLLNEIYNVKDKFILLEFDNDEIVIKYQKEIFDLLNSFKMMYISDLEKIFIKYKIDSLLEKLKKFNKNIKINEKLLYNNFNNLNLNDLSYINNIKIDYQNQSIIKKIEFSKDNNNFEIYLIGDIYSDFLSLFKTMKGGKDE